MISLTSVVFPEPDGPVTVYSILLYSPFSPHFYQRIILNGNIIRNIPKAIELKETISLKYKYQNILIFCEAESDLDVEIFERRLLVVPLARADDEMQHILHGAADVRAQLEALVLLIV